MKDSVPAWMLCVDLLNRIKRELVTEAMDTLDREVEAKRIDIKGALVSVPDQPSDTEMKLFVIGRMLENADSMKERYGKYIYDIESKGKDVTAIELQNYERAKLFLLALEKISTLVHYSNMLDQWINDASLMVGEKSQDEIIRATSDKGDRKTILSYIIKNRTLLEEEVISKSERKMLEEAL